VTDPIPSIGIVAALAAEARCLGVARSSPGEAAALAGEALVVRSGIGARRAEAAATLLLQAGVKGLVSWGTAAALSAETRRGTLVLAEAVHAGDGSHYAVEPGWRHRLHRSLALHMDCYGGVCAEATEVLTEPEDKQRLHGSSGARIADMESAAIAGVAHRAGVPFLCVRAVSDDSVTGIPRSARLAVDEGGEIRVLDCLAGLARRPTELATLIRLLLGFNAACGVLARSVRLAGASLQFRTEG
jgi:adenosylhomocysteine nucleosidase